MYTIEILNKDTKETVFSRANIVEYTYNKGLLNELTMSTNLARIYTIIRDNEILTIRKN